MDASAINALIRPQPLTTGRIIHPFDLPNLTAKSLDILFTPIPEKSIKHRHAVIFGGMESGKTTLYNTLAAIALKRYGTNRVNLIPVRSVSDGLDLIDNKLVQIMFIDDAVRNANSRKAMSQADDIADYYEIRHIYKRMANRPNGIVITLWAAQRFKSLDIVFRSAHVMIFKTIPTDPSDQKFISNQIGSKAYEELAHITRRIYEDADDSAKGFSVVHLPFSRRTGTFRHKAIDGELLNFDVGNKTEFDTLQPFLFDVGKVLSEYEKKREWKREARAYYLWKFEKVKQENIAKDSKVKANDAPTVSRLIKSMRGELSRLAGRDYEIYTAERLKAAGYDVKLGGRVSEPDIIAKMDQVHKVYSCKCLDYQKKTTLGMSELRPEILYSLETGARLILSVFNLHTSENREIELCANNLQERIELIP